MNWKILGIEPTKDKKAITAAYRAKLQQTNPEDKPEEFKELRAAYEEALQLAAQPDAEPVRDESPLGLWKEKLRALYDNFAARINPEYWKELLADDVCLALDKRPLAEEALMRFLMEDYYVPQTVWQLFDDTFALMARQQELYESYPRDFIDYAVINGIRYSPSLPYELFTPGINGKDCDEYRRLYYQANQTAPAEMGPVLEQMAALSESHPYGQALIHRLELENGQTDQGREGYRRLAEAYPDDTVLNMGWASLCAQNGDWAECEKLTRHVLKLMPEHQAAKRLLADSLAGQDRHDDAKELIYELMHVAGGNQIQLQQLSDILKNWNQILIERREATLQEHPEDNENAIELAWCYLQNEQFDDALRAAQAVSPDHEDTYAYHNLHAKLYYAREEYDKSLEHLLVIEEILRNLQPDGTEETAKRIKRLPEMLQRIGSCLMIQKREDEAFIKYEQAYELAPEDPEILTHMGSLLYGSRKYERAVELLEKLTALLPGSYHGFMLLSLCHFELNRDRDAFDAVNRALQLEGGDLRVYIHKMRILIRNGVWEQVHEILDFLRQHGITNELPVAWCEAQLTEFEQKDDAKALEQYQAIAERLENGDYLDWASQVYYRIAALIGDLRDANKPEDREELLEILEKGLAKNAHDKDCLSYKAWLLKKSGRLEDALYIYHKLEEEPNHPINIEHNLADIYYRNLGKNAKKSLHYYRLVMERNEHPDFYFYAATCSRYIGDYEAAEKDFLREQELAPDDVDGFNGLAYVYEAMNRYEDALIQVNKAIDLVQERKGDFSFLYSHKIQILRRLNRPSDALATLTEANVKYNQTPNYRLKFDICCQFGLWSDTKKVLDAWKKAKTNQSGYHTATVKYELYQGNAKKANSLFLKAAKGMNGNDLDSLRLLLAELENDVPKLVEIWNRKLDTSNDDTHALMNLAQVLWRDGRRDEARDAAAKALHLLEEQLKLYMNNEVLYRGRRAMVLALCGRLEEAKAQLADAMKMPLCEGCSYGICKDAYIFEASIEECCGDPQKALELYRAGLERWPDELDFLSGINRLTKKSK